MAIEDWVWRKIVVSFIVNLELGFDSLRCIKLQNGVSPDRGTLKQLSSH